MKKYFGTNTKMFMDVAHANDYIQRLIDLTGAQKDYELFVLPSFLSIASVKERVTSQHATLHIGAQNTAYETSGEFTGEVSINSLKEVGAEIVMVGHSERRNKFHETDIEIQAKTDLILNHGLIVLLCVGDNLDDKNFHTAKEKIRLQLKQALAHVTLDQSHRVWIGYEPVWAIGKNGIPAEPSYVQEIVYCIKDALEEILPGNEIPVLYGGSVNPDNAPKLIQLEKIDGLFIGRSAWDADKFVQLIQSVL